MSISIFLQMSQQRFWSLTEKRSRNAVESKAIRQIRFHAKVLCHLQLIQSLQVCQSNTKAWLEPQVEILTRRLMTSQQSHFGQLNPSKVIPALRACLVCFATTSCGRIRILLLMSQEYRVSLEFRDFADKLMQRSWVSFLFILFYVLLNCIRERKKAATSFVYHKILEMIKLTPETWPQERFVLRHFIWNCPLWSGLQPCISVGMAFLGLLHGRVRVLLSDCCRNANSKMLSMWYDSCHIAHAMFVWHGL